MLPTTGPPFPPGRAAASKVGVNLVFDDGPTYAQAGSRLIAIAKARSWMAEPVNGTIASTDAIAAQEQLGERDVRKLLPLACVPPKVIQAIVDGHAPADLTIRTLTAALPHPWVDQHQRFLIA